MKTPRNIGSVLFALDQGFGALRTDTVRNAVKVLGLDLEPATAAALSLLKSRQIRTGLLLPESFDSRVAKTLQGFLPDTAIVKCGGRNLSQALKSFFSKPEEGLFVAADRFFRGRAAASRIAALPHPALIASALEHNKLLFIKAKGTRSQLEQLQEALPYSMQCERDDLWTMLAVAPANALKNAFKIGIRLEVLPLDISTEDPVIVQLDEPDAESAAALPAQKVLAVEQGSVLLALGPEQYADDLPIHGRHGHFQALFPDPGLLKYPLPAENAFKKAQIMLGSRLLKPFDVIPLPVDFPPIVFRPCPISAASFQTEVNRYTGAANLDAGGPVISRHINHPGNARVVQSLVNDLQAMGYCAYTEPFTYAGRTLHNVIADLPGRGFWQINPDLLDRIRKILIKFPLPDPPDPWLKPLMQYIDHQWLESHLKELSPWEMRKKIEYALDLKPWYSWWHNACFLPGWGAQLVIVGCHLDSTAGSSPGYNSATDAAPGMDDNASGITATLALARFMWQFRNKLPHTVRFCFFNAEEQGLIGSKAHAAKIKTAGAPVKAVVCTDMIGYNSDPNRIFEIHAGYTDAAVRDQSVPVADTVAAWAASLGALAPAQVYKGTSSSGGPDRNLYDGAINRSDHAAFHQQGYPAVVVSEDFFANLASEPGADPNPNYHRTGDTLIDSAYAADITCALAYAVKELAGG